MGLQLTTTKLPAFSWRLLPRHARGRGALLAYFAIAFCLVAHPSAAGKKAIDWQGATSVETQAETDAANPMCQQLSANISKRVASIKSYQDAIAKSAAGPPRSMKSAFEDVFGTRQPDAKTREYERKIKAERKSADELNHMMRSSQCTPIDIDAALAKQKSDERAAPEVPKEMPDDLVRAPQPY